MPSLELGAPRLDYGSALAASTSASSWRGGDGCKANVTITEEGGRPFYCPFLSLSLNFFIAFYIINKTLIKILIMHTVASKRNSHSHGIHTARSCRSPSEVVCSSLFFVTRGALPIADIMIVTAAVTTITLKRPQARRPQARIAEGKQLAG
jgi:hypothetical protein